MVDDPLDKVSPDQLAAIFSRRLRQQLTAEEMAYVIRCNKAERNPHVCHSHDFVDANELMLAACIELTGLSDWWAWLNVDKACKLWRCAWSIARTTEFAAGDWWATGCSMGNDANRPESKVAPGQLGDVLPPRAPS